MPGSVSIISPPYLSGSKNSDTKTPIGVQSISERLKSTCHRSIYAWLSFAAVGMVIIIIMVTCCKGKQETASSVQDCNSYEWKSFNKVSPNDNVEYAGYDVFNDKQLAICRLNMNGEIVVGKAIMELKSCWIPYGGSELWYTDTHDFEVLTHSKNVRFTWVKNDKGSAFPPGTVSAGSDISETAYVGRCKWKSTVGDEITPGTLYKEFYGINARALTFSYGGKVRDCDSDKYEIMTCG